jgi:patatin-related protein
MRQKELRLAMVCYGGISLAVYMHGVTKEVWKLARASTHGPTRRDQLAPGEAIYADLLDAIAHASGVRINVMPDIVAGASAGGMNGVFLAQAIHTGQSLEPLTRMWLDHADIDSLIEPEGQGWTSLAKQWTVPLVRRIFANGTDDPSSPAHAEIRAKLTRLVRSRWFEAPFSGIGFSRLIAGALDAMAAGETGVPLLPIGHPVDLFTTATDFAGHAQRVALHSPAWVEEREHRVGIGFTAAIGGGDLAALPELVFAARATASFPGAFPPLQVGEIDALMAERGEPWPGRDAFLARILPAHVAAGTEESAALMDGSILVNAPFSQAIAALPARPAETEIDRRLIYIDPTQPAVDLARADGAPGFFSAIFRALSTIPREQPIRDNLEALARQSEVLARARAIMDAIRPDAERSVLRVLGEGVDGPCPTAEQLGGWRAAAHGTAAREAGYAYQAHARLKLEGTLDALAQAIATPGMAAADVRASLGRWAGHNLRLSATDGTGLSSELIEFLRAHDGAYRQRRLRHVAARLDDARQILPDIEPRHHDAAHEAVWRALSLALGARHAVPPDPAQVLDNPGAMLRRMAEDQPFRDLDTQVDALIARVLPTLPQALKRLLLLAYLGFAFYDVATLALIRGGGMAEMNPVQVDRISPQDASGWGRHRRLKGEEFHYFAAFFSRAYREHDYLLGRLHGAGRMMDFLASTSPVPLAAQDLARIRAKLFAAILDEEAPHLLADPQLIPTIRAEIESEV